MQVYVEAMQPGTNLGNTLDAIPNEDSWGAPYTTQAIIQQIAAQGYKSIRIPVTWHAHVGPAPTYTVDPAWMDRVQQVVDWSLDSGMYVMLNAHHDSWQWLSAMPANHDAVMAKYSAIWTQISARFANYSNKLMFEATNEQTFDGVDHATALTYLNELETTFHSIVRSSGGQNGTRPLVLTVWGGSGDQQNMDSLKATINSLNDPNLIATIHFYGFWPFSVNNSGYTKFESTSIDGIISQFDSAYNTFVANGIPVVVGEIGLLEPSRIEHGELLKYFEYAMQYVRSKSLTHMLWDTGGIFDRTTFQWRDPELRAVMAQSLVGRSTTANTDLIFLKSGAPVGDAIVQLNLNGNTFVSLADGLTTLNAGTDYTLVGNILTVKASVLAKYASGGFGEKTVLSVNVNSGPAWNIHVRYFSTPVQSAAVGTIGGLTIPTQFNGDLLATMEAKYSDGSNAGPLNWTPYQEHTVSFSPDYWASTISLTNKFFAATHNGTINLAFHFWSGAIVNYQVSLQLRATLGGPDLPIYDDNLAPTWQNWSWASVNTANADPVHSGTQSISVTAGSWAALNLGYVGGNLDLSPYHTLTFWLNGGATGGQKFNVGASVNWDYNYPSVTIDSVPANTWTKVVIPLASLGLEGKSGITTLYFINSSGGDSPTYYIDDLHFSTEVAPTDLVVTGSIPAASPLTITKSGFALNRRTNRMVQTVTVSNPTGSTVAGPIYLVLDSLSSNTTLANAAGTTWTVVPTGSPYVLVSNGGLASQASVRVSLEFTVPSLGGITYAARTLSGGTNP